MGGGGKVVFISLGDGNRNGGACGVCVRVG